MESSHEYIILPVIFAQPRFMASKQVILTENIPGLGAEADVVTVRAGFARNFLLPQKKACEVTPATLRQINFLKAKRAEREARELAEAQELARKINKLNLQFTLETGETGKAFGSITNQDLAERLKGELGGLVFDRHKIALERPIKESGAFEIPVKLHGDVTATLKIAISAGGAELDEDDSGADENTAAKEPPARAKRKK